MRRVIITGCLLSVVLVLAAFLAIPSSPVAGSAPDFDAARDFSATANPAGTWSYGWSSSRAASFNLDTAGWHGSSGLDAWAPSIDGLPVVAHNGTSGTITSACCNPLPAGQLLLHPSNAGGNAVIRWTAPAGGTYEIRATFRGIDYTSTDVAILQGTLELFSGLVNGRGAEQSFAGTRTLASGETVDFKVGFGNGNYYSDSTSLDATITSQAPTAVTLAGFGAASGVVGGWPLAVVLGIAAALGGVALRR